MWGDGSGGSSSSSSQERVLGGGGGGGGGSKEGRGRDESSAAAAAAASRAAASRPLPARSKGNIAMTSPPAGTIEEQIRQVDKIVKECDNSRKCLDMIGRRLDDLNDEVKRYRDFLGHEKARRDPALYKTSNSDRPSVYNDNICGTLSSLTNQLTMEWVEKLQTLHNIVQPQQPSTPASRNNSDRV